MGYDSATAASYAYYAWTQAQAAVPAPVASTSADWVSSSVPLPCLGGGLDHPSLLNVSADQTVLSCSLHPQYANQSAPVINPWDEVDVSQQQQAYGMPTGSLNPADTADASAEPAGGKTKGKRTTVIRKGGGKMWDDESLIEWDPKWFRLFVSDVSNDCTEKVLTEAFSKYKSFQKTKVIKDRLSNKVSTGMHMDCRCESYSTDIMLTALFLRISYSHSTAVKVRVPGLFGP